MAKPFNKLGERLLRAGVAPRHVRRYLRELGDHLADLKAEEAGAGLRPADAESAALIRLGRMDDLAKAMIEQRRFQSWCARAPWAVLGLAPLLLLAGGYVVACLILWSGWNMFLPGRDTPFVQIHGLAIIYFGVGRMIFFGAPVLIGWGIGLIAARQRLKTLWPILGLVLIAWVGGTARVHASPPALPDSAGHISVGLGVGPFIEGISYGPMHALVILALTVLPYLIWRFQQARSLS